MFFDASSFKEPRLSMDHFREWANVIASSYLSDGVAPTTSLVKIAQSEELTPHQVGVLAGEANKLIHTTKYASAGEKYFAAEFPLADAKVAIEQLQGGAEKVAAVLAEPTFSDDGPDHYAMWGIEAPGPLDKTASVKHELKVAALKTELVQQKTNDSATLAKYAADASERRFIKTARQMVLDQSDSLARMKMLGTIEHFVKQAGMPFARRSLAKLAYVLGQEGKLTPGHTKTAMDHFISKEADQKAPQELISEWLPARVVNGNHPLYITLKTFRDASERCDLLDGHSKIVEDRLNIVRQKVRAL